MDAIAERNRDDVCKFRHYHPPKRFPRSFLEDSTFLLFLTVFTIIDREEEIEDGSDANGHICDIESWPAVVNDVKINKIYNMIVLNAINEIPKYSATEEAKSVLHPFLVQEKRLATNKNPN